MTSLPFVVSISQCVAGLHIDYLRNASHPSPPSPFRSCNPPDINGWGWSHTRTPPLGSGTSDLVKAYKHLRSALTSFRTEVTAVNQANWIACIAFSSNILVVNLDNARRAPLDDFQAVVVDPIRALRNTLSMRSSVAPLIPTNLATVGQNELRQHREDSPDQIGAAESSLWCEESLARMDDLLQRLEKYTGQEVATLSTNLEDFVNFMDEIKPVPLPSGKNSDTRQLAAVALRAWAQLLGVKPPRLWADLCSWTWCLSTDFISLLASKDEATLVITVYWFVVISRAAPKWYSEGWARRAVTACLRHVGPDWSDTLAWPKSQLGLG